MERYFNNLSTCDVTFCEIFMSKIQKVVKKKNQCFDLGYDHFLQQKRTVLNSVPMVTNSLTVHKYLCH